MHSSHSYYLWSISHPDSNGIPAYNLSSDNQAIPTTTNTMTQTQLALEQIINKAFNHYSVSLDITDKIRATFKTKLWRMGRKLSKTGGKQRKELLHRWEEGEESLWNFTVDESEATSQMMAHKRKVENQLHQERVKDKN